MTEWEDLTNEEMEFEGEIWKPQTPGDHITGEYIECEEGVGMDGNSILYHIKEETPDGEYWKVWGSAVLNDAMRKANLGELVKITYLGQRKSKQGRTYNNFKVQRAKTEDSEGESPPNPPSTTPKQEHIMDMETVDMSPGVHTPEDLEDKDKVAEEWLKRIHQDFLGQGTNPTRKMMFTELNAMFMDEAKEDDLGLLDKDMAKRVFRLIKESKEYRG